MPFSKNPELRIIHHIAKLQTIAQNGLDHARDPYDLMRYQHLQQITAEIVSEYTTLTAEQAITIFRNDIHYATPKMDVRGALFYDGQILLVQESSDHLWSLPGGWADVNNSPKEAIEREILEETGYLATAVKLIALYDEQKHPHPFQLPHSYKSLFLCDLHDKVQEPDLEIEHVAFFSESNLPPLSASRVTQWQIMRCFEHYKKRSLPTEFD